MVSNELETTLWVPQPDLELARQLTSELGFTLEKPTFRLADPTHPEAWVTEDFIGGSAMFVRFIVRDAALEKLGFVKHEGVWIPNPGGINPLPAELVFCFKLTIGFDKTYSENPTFRSLLANPDHLHYNWDQAAIWNLGRWEEVRGPLSYRPLINPDKGILLFSDEVEKLNRGETVVTLHAEGFAFGWLNGTREAYVVNDGNLYLCRSAFDD